MGLAESIKGTIGKLAARHKERKEHEKEHGSKHHEMKHREKEKDDDEEEEHEGKKKHIGFKGAQAKVESEGYSKKIAGAIIASKSRGASKEAHKENPRLNRVKG